MKRVMMKVNNEHHDFVEKHIEKLNTCDLRNALMGKGLTKSQSNSCIKNTRKRLKIYRYEK